MGVFMKRERSKARGVSRIAHRCERNSAAPVSRLTAFPSRWLRLAGAIGATLLVLGWAPAHAQTYNVLENFSGGNGRYPLAGLVADSAGDLYGTTFAGGASGYGEAFELKPSTSGGYTETVLYSFTGSTDGGNPRGRLLLDSQGNLFGTAETGGDSAGDGVVFELTPSSSSLTGYNETTIWTFDYAGGANPYGGLVLDSAGNLFGTTSSGGAGLGVVFELTPSTSSGYSETVLWTFGYSDGATPLAGLAKDGSGNLYGTTNSGGANGCGEVFKLDASSSYAGSVLYSFSGCLSNSTDGAYPQGGLVLDSAGNLYGTTVIGGGPSGCGTVFEVTPSTSTESVPYIFDCSGAYGSFPFGALVRGATGNFYGTASSGGASGYGAVFQLSPPATSGGTYSATVLHSFAGPPSDGENPQAGLVQDSAGNFYGTTEQGGSSGSTTNAGQGTVFQLAVASSVPFASLTASLTTTAGPPPGFNLQANFTLGSGSSGIHPSTQALTVQIGNYTLTIPAGSFQPLPNSKFNYNGTIAGVTVAAQLAMTGPGTYKLHISGSGVDLTGLTNPVITITIGDNTGSTQDPPHGH